MPTINWKDRFTRRGFIGLSAAAAASLGVLDATNASEAVTGEKLDASTPNFLPIKAKIALEEHFAFPELLDTSYAAMRSAEFQSQITEISTSRIAEMDRGGVQLCILSLVAPPSDSKHVTGCLRRAPSE